MTITQLNRWGYLITPVLFLAVSLIWSQLTYSTWDDDAATRFFATLTAAEHPQSFLDSWLRPLFVQVFYLPIHFFGRMGLVVTMSLLTAGSSILVYKGLEAKGIHNIYAAVFFHLSQTFLFGITRDAMTEPLAAFIMSLGVYFYFREKWVWFAVAGSFLPLARTETVLLLPIWAWILLRQKKYLHILLLGVGMSLLFLGWFIYSGNFHAFFDNNIRGTSAPNRYARTDWDHYFNKLPYVIGPVIFIFLLLGYVVHLKKIFTDLFFMLQFTVGFLLYVVFGSADISLGQAAGFLRHLVTFAPLVAVISLYGFNYWMGIERKESQEAEAQLKPDKKKGKHKKGSGGMAAGQGNVKKGLVTLFLFILLVVAAKLMSNKLLYRQFYSEDEKDFTLLYFIAFAAFCVFISLWMVPKKLMAVVIALLFAAQVGFTLYFEAPQAHSNEEREALSQAANWVLQCKLMDKPVYCNHLWLYWTLMCAKGINMPQNRIDSSSLQSMPAGSIVIWEPHYTSKNYSNIPLSMLTNNSSFEMINFIQDEEKATRALLFVKQADPAAIQKLFTHITEKDSTNANLLLLKAVFEKTKLKDLNSSTKSLDRAIGIEPQLADAYFQRGENYLLQNQADKACTDLKSARSLGNQEAIRLIGLYCPGQ